MPTVSVSEGFLDAWADLDPVDGKRVGAFLEKLIGAPEAASLRPEIVHDAADRSVRSFKVTHDLRALAWAGGDQLLLLHVARHDRAYTWARTHCVNCHPVTGEYLVVSLAGTDERAEPCADGGTSGSDSTAVPLGAHLCSSSRDLCRVLEGRGIDCGRLLATPKDSSR